MSALGNASLSGARKAAILLSLLGDEPAATILRNLPDHDLQRVTDEVANLGHVPFDVTLDVLEEYQQMMSAQDFIAVGGQDVATRLLVKAFGENGAKSMVQRLMGTDNPGLLEVKSLKKADPQQLAKFLVGERPQTKALVLGQPRRQAGIRAVDEHGARRARRLRETPGQPGPVFSGGGREGLRGAESAVEDGWRSQQARGFRFQECCRDDEPHRLNDCARDPGEHRERAADAGHQYSRPHVPFR